MKKNQSSGEDFSVADSKRINMPTKTKHVRDNSPGQPIKVNPIISVIIFLERVFEVIEPGIEFLGRGLITLFIMSYHPVFIINAILIVWTFKPLIDVLEI